MERRIQELGHWLNSQERLNPYFSATFWFVLSRLKGEAFLDSLKFRDVSRDDHPEGDYSAAVAVGSRRDQSSDALFWYLNESSEGIHVLLSLTKAWQTKRHVLQLLSRSRGKAHLFPIGEKLLRSCVRLNGTFDFSDTMVLRGVSYPGDRSGGGADINLRPGNASVFFKRLEDEKRVLKSARMRAPIGKNSYCEYTASRIGYITYHNGDTNALLEHILGRLPELMTKSVKPFKNARNRFVALNFGEPVFSTPSTYKAVLTALSRLPHSSMAVLHSNPYFHATLTNYEDGGEFDVFITDSSSVHLQGRGSASPATFVQLHNNLAEIFRDATVSLETIPEYTLRDLLEGRV